MLAKPSQTSVVMGCYNGAKYLAEQLESLARQTVLPLELLIADDGSTDETVAIAQAFAARAPFPVQVDVNAHNLGFGENFLQAAQRASGSYIAFCDQDDIWRADKLAVCEAALAANPRIVLAVHTARLISDDKAVIGSFTQGIVESRTRPAFSFRPWDVFFGFSMVFRRSLLTAVPAELRCMDYISGAPKLAHDRWILFLANLLGSTHEIALPLADYRQHGGNLFGSKKHSKAFSRHQILLDSQRYLVATEQQRRVVEALAMSQEAGLLGFDRDKARAFMDRAVKQQRARHRLYTSDGVRVAGCWLYNLTTGVYLSIPDSKFLPRAVLKDMLFPFAR